MSEYLEKIKAQGKKDRLYGSIFICSCFLLVGISMCLCMWKYAEMVCAEITLDIVKNM